MSIAEAATGRSREASPEVDYKELKARVVGLGLYQPQPIYYTLKLVLTYTLFALPYVLMVFVGGYWAAAGFGVLAAFANGQVALSGHDLAHKQFGRPGLLNDTLALSLGNFGIGLSRAWWTHKHNRHHSFPNQEGKDPDIMIEALSFTQEQALRKRGWVRVFDRYQAFLFFPILTLEWLHMRVEGVRWLLTNRARLRGTELALALVSVIWTPLVPLLLLGWGPGLVFLGVSQALSGLYLGAIFAPNHKGMPMLDEDDQMDFFRRQVITARNVRGGPVTDYVYGALNYQIEHHLFPSMPRNKLGRAQEVVKRFCAEKSVPYHETGVVQSFREILSSLHDASSPLREHH